MAELLDARGLRCPLPVLKARKAIRDLHPGQELRILATDPGASKDFAHFCETTGHTLIAATEEEGVLVFLIRKSA
ncbi:MAG TPA: sulfurtransferase TusA family protein [Stellaceae bacterium]|nr:sulfurtransferase TusA family protein [Stellaceae bacterium]